MIFLRTCCSAKYIPTKNHIKFSRLKASLIFRMSKIYAFKSEVDHHQKGATFRELNRKDYAFYF